MKKKYLAPDTETLEYLTTQLLSVSDMTSDGDVDDIGFGGSDDDGDIDPSSRETDDFWY